MLTISLQQRVWGAWVSALPTARPQTRSTHLNRSVPKHHDGQEHEHGRHQRLDHRHSHDIAVSVAGQGVEGQVGLYCQQGSRPRCRAECHVSVAKNKQMTPIQHKSSADPKAPLDRQHSPHGGEGLGGPVYSDDPLLRAARLRHIKREGCAKIT